MSAWSQKNDLDLRSPGRGKLHSSAVQRHWEGTRGQTRDATLKAVGPHREITEKGKENQCPERASWKR